MLRENHSSPVNLTKVVAAVIIVTFVVLRVVALFSVEMIGDEPDDLSIIQVEIDAVPRFFQSERTYELDQARLPHYLSMPLVFLFQDAPLIPLRIMFFFFHVLYLYISYRLIKFLFGDTESALGYVALLSLSTFLACFSVYAITTGDSLYLMFNVLSIYIFVTNYREFTRTGTFRNLVLLILVLALCVSSKLFGVLLLAAFFVYMIAVGRGKWRIRTFPAFYLIVADIVFLVLLSVINFSSLAPVYQTFTSLGLGFLFVASIVGFLFMERRSRVPLRETRFIAFWVAIGLTAFCLTLFFSPTYLNLSNLARIPTWFSSWGTGKIVARSNRYDMLIIVALKYGVPSLVCLIAVVGILLFRNRLEILRTDRNASLLFLIVFVIHFVAISAVSFKVTWYPLAIFPFLYLPFIHLWKDVREKAGRALKIAFLCLSLVLVADNVYRHARWFPYGHFDGAQYGREHVGWNRAGMVTFEIIPTLVDCLDSIPAAPGERILFQVVDVPRYNDWFRYLVEVECSKRPSPPFRLISTPFEQNGRYSYILTSPAYFGEFDERMRDMALEEIRTLSIKRIDILRLWKFE